MKGAVRFSAVLVLLIGQAAAQQECALPFSPPPNQMRTVFLLDTSGSMEGRGSSVANIFAKVKGAMLRGTRATTAPGSVSLYTFDAGLQKQFNFAWPQQRSIFEQTLNPLTAPGANTWLYRSLQELFGKLPRQAQSATTVYVITDGIDNNPDKQATLNTALDVFKQSRGPFDKLYYVALGARIPAEVRARFALTDFAKAVELPVGQAPDFTSVRLSPAMLTVGADASFPYARPAGTQLSLESSNIGGAEVNIGNPSGAGARVSLKVQGNVPAGSVGYMCAELPDDRQNVLLRFDRTTPPLSGVVAGPVDVLGTLVLLGKPGRPVLTRGQSATLTYKAVRGPVTVEIASVPPSIAASLPDQTVSLLEGEQVKLKITDKSLTHGQVAAPVLRLNDATPYKVPPVEGKVVKPFPWWWLLLALVIVVLLLFYVPRALRPFTPYALSVDRQMRVFLHDRSGRRKTRLLRRPLIDIGRGFRERRLHGLVLERYRPEPEEWVVLDNSNMQSIREFSAQQLRRAARLQTQPDTLRLHKHGQDEDVFLQEQEMLQERQLYIFTDYTAPPLRVRPPMPPAEPPIEIIVTLLTGADMQELDLPIGDVDLADVFGQPHLRGLVVRREVGLLRLRGLDEAMRLRHISREFRPGEALPLAVMLSLGTASGPYQLRIRDKASLSRYQR